MAAHRYWRINIPAVQSTGYAALAEVQFRTTAGVPLLFSGGTASASSFDSAPYVASMAADNNTATFWASGNPVPQWWGYDYGAGNALAIVEITILPRSDYPTQGPASFTPQWSDDGTNWTSMAQLTGGPWDAGVVQTFAVSAAPPAFSVWSASDAAATGMTLTNGGLTVTSNPVGGVWGTVRTTVSHATGKVYIEFLCGSPPSDDRLFFGLASSGFSSADYLGDSNYSGGIYPANANYNIDGFTQNYEISVDISPNDVFALAVDFAVGSVWIAQNGVWLNSSNPAIGLLPILSFTPATVGALFAGLSFYAADNAWTLQPTVALQKYAPPAGFSAWDPPVVVSSAQARALVLA
jgi:hypothetical protein